jgi:hypothetical protein
LREFGGAVAADAHLVDRHAQQAQRRALARAIGVLQRDDVERRAHVETEAIGVDKRIAIRPHPKPQQDIYFVIF